MADGDDKNQVESQPDEAEGAPESKTGKAQIDLQALAEKVYALMQQELRIERERMGRRY